jgi:hypothetical protein|tara:strand:+ start:596 stop:916 length:321 start_codon:yes stop_codon:yes gene_type:complete
MAQAKINKVVKGLKKASKSHAKQAETLESIKMKKGGKVKSGGKICEEGKAWAKRTFDKYPSAYANMAASKYCKDPNYAKKSKRQKKANGGPVSIRGQGIVMRQRLR